MLKTKSVLLVIAVVLGVVSCGTSSQGNDNSSGKDYPNRTNSQAPQMVVCPMCGGFGEFEYMSGDIMAPKTLCTGCNGQGKCDVATAQQIMQIQSQFDKDKQTHRSVAEIQYDLQKARELLASMEDGYKNCSSVVTKSQYPRMISDQKAHIRRLEEELQMAYWCVY